MVTSLPALMWRPTAAASPRYGHPVKLVVVHRWGVRYVDQPHEALSFQGVINFFSNTANRASAHIVYPGTAVPNTAAQMVAWADMAWAEAAFNPVSDEIESADSIWLGHDAKGLDQLALMVAQRLHTRMLPPVWSSHMGFCRHADLGQPGGGHLECPTTDLALWRHFVLLVQAHHRLIPPGISLWGR